MPGTIKQTVTFRSTPHEVYEALMDSKKHGAFTGSKASISREVGGRISAYDGYIEGTNVELVPDIRIVQTWRASDWPEGVFSQVTFEFTAIPEGTRLKFLHTDLPQGTEEEFTRGWIENYWEPMKAFLEK